ncbi:MAG: hypothetical protein O3A99_09685 [Proteobacteria bacterium]|nr:hypothetical protein [Pseudomonadota bacterium]
MKNIVNSGLVLSIMTLVGCATLTNDAQIPISLSFSDNSEGTCELTNKRMQLSVQVPGTAMVRRSDDALRIDCETENGDRATGSVQSEMGAKIIASAVFLDFGIVDAITDKHRNYSSSFVIPVKNKKKEKSEPPL